MEQLGIRLQTYVCETEKGICKHRGFWNFRFRREEYDSYLATYEEFEPDQKLVDVLLVGRKYINVCQERPFFGRTAFLEDVNADVVKTNSEMLGDIPVKDFLFNLLSPNPEWREIYPGEIGLF